MKPNSQSIVTISAVAPALRRLRLGTSSARPSNSNEVLPHNYGTHKTDTVNGTAESLLVETHADSGAPAATAWAGCLRYLRETRQQFSHASGIARLCRAAIASVGLLRALPVRRSGDCTRESVGEEEARIDVVENRKWGAYFGSNGSKFGETSSGLPLRKLGGTWRQDGWPL
jgi:hypothetical protein